MTIWPYYQKMRQGYIQGYKPALIKSPLHNICEAPQALVLPDETTKTQGGKCYQYLYFRHEGDLVELV